MDRRAFETALRAAARITFGTTLIGCGATVVYDEVEESEEEYASGGGGSGGAGYVDSPYAQLPPDEEPVVCEGPPEDVAFWSTHDPALFACCIGHVDAVFSETPELDWDWETPIAPETRNCCMQLLVDNKEAMWSGEPLPHPAPEDVLSACCLVEHGNAGCTPWGPPVPPSIDPDDFVPWLATLPGNDVEPVAA